MKYILVALLATSSVLAGCSSVGVGLRAGEEALYSPLSVDGNFEIRSYEPIIVAQTAVSGSYNNATKLGYQRLTDYVSGSNLARQTVSVNDPVQVLEGQKAPKIDLTLPYYEEYIDGTWVVSVAMPEAYTLETLPKPLNNSITFKILPNLKVATVRYTGFKSEAAVSKNTNLLKDWMSRNNLVAASAPRSVIYDSPLTVPVLRRNEIHISLK